MHQVKIPSKPGAGGATGGACRHGGKRPVSRSRNSYNLVRNSPQWAQTGTSFIGVPVNRCDIILIPI